MYESRIAADHQAVTALAGIAPEIDVLAARNLSGHGFLRRAWHRAGTTEPGRTLVVRDKLGGPLAAIPTLAFGPALAGARKVPGAYWPFRSPLIAPECSVFELAQGLGHPAARSLGRVWRVGPAKMGDPTIERLVAAAHLAGWRVLSRPAGTSWVIDCDAARADGWPNPSTAKRMGRIERRLAKLGDVAWHHVRGSGWSETILEELGAVEAASWVGTETDGKGAKFMQPHQRGAWRAALADPVISEMLCATILRINGEAVAFSFDLDDGPVRYGIAGTYKTAYGKHEVGKLANFRAIDDASAAGKQVVDLGAGDSGYKREMGAVRGYDLADLLFVRHRVAAALLARVWGKPLAAPPGTAMVASGIAHG